MRKASLDELEKEIYEKRKDVRYDIRDMTVEAIVRKYIDDISDDNVEKNVYNYIFIPEYQRDFTWDVHRQSKFIESVIMGLPIPFLFIAENRDSSWEIVDGSQRIRTLNAFVNGKLRLQGLTAVKALNGYKFDELEPGRQGKFLNTALRIIVLSEETTDDAKKEMFERINRGSDLLKPMEKRKGIYKGCFTEFIYNYCKENEKYKELAQVDKWLEKRQEREELLLRFFALTDTRAFENGIRESIADFLDKYLKEKNRQLDELDAKERKKIILSYKKRIDKVIDYVGENFPFGFRHRQNPQTKRSVFEAISVGVWLAISDNSIKTKLDKEQIAEKLSSPEFSRYTHIANELHRKQKLNGRVMAVYNMVSGKIK